MATEFKDVVDKHGWNDIEKGIMWVWWEFIDPIIGYSIFGYGKNDPRMHSYLNWVTKMAITATLPLFLLVFILLVMYLRARNGSEFIIPTESEASAAAEGETMSVDQYGPITREDKIEVLHVLKEATTTAIKYLEKRYKRKKLTDPAYQKTLRTLGLQIQKIENTIKKTEGATMRDLFGDSSGVPEDVDE